MARLAHVVCRFLGGLGVCVAVALGAEDRAKAELLAYEGFNYPVGLGLEGLTGGIGWDLDRFAGWDNLQGKVGADEVEAGSMSYTDSSGHRLATSGNKLRNSGAAGTSRGGRFLKRRTGDGHSTWISFLGERQGELHPEDGTIAAGTFSGGAFLSLFDAFNNESERINIGENSHVQYARDDGRAEDRWFVRAAGVSHLVVAARPLGQHAANPLREQLKNVFTDVPFGGRTSLYVMRIDHIGEDSIGDDVYFWMNPDLDAEPDEVDAAGSFVAADIEARARELMVDPYDEPVCCSGGDMSFDRVRLFAEGGSTRRPFAQWIIDEIRIGESFADITPHTPGFVGTPGDYNADGVVNAADYTVWRNNFGTANLLANDPLGGEITLAQYDQWQRNFVSLRDVRFKVAEPSLPGIAILFIGGVCLLTKRRRERVAAY